VIKNEDRLTWRIVAGTVSVIGLLVVYLFQYVDVYHYMFRYNDNPAYAFIVNRSIRYLINDACMISLIYALFNERKYVLFGVFIQFVGIVLFLTPYFIIKFKFPFYNGPLISFLHRLVINPLLMILLIPAIFYQKSIGRNG
jgi:exosortase F-associated protein